jgi:hypothetical protein
MFLLPINHAHELQLATAPPENQFFSSYKLTFFRRLLPCAEYSLSAEYSAAFSCRIFVFGRNKKIRFRSISTVSPSHLSLSSAPQPQHTQQVEKKGDEHRAPEPERVHHGRELQHLARGK